MEYYPQHTRKLQSQEINSRCVTVVLGKMGSSSGWRNNGFSGADLTPPGGCVEGGKVAEGCLRMDRFFFWF